MRKFMLGLLLALMLFCRILFAEEIREPIFYLPFDGDIVVQGTLKIDNTRVYMLEGSKIRYIPGVKDYDYALITGNGWIKYYLHEALNISEGTISMWIKPLDWDDKSYLDFFRTYTYMGDKYKNIFRIYRPFSSFQGISVLKYKEPPPYVSMYLHRKIIDTWRKQEEQWHNIVFTWKESKGIMYVDGLEIATNDEIADTLKESNVIEIGGATIYYYSEGNSVTTNKTTAIDEIVLYDYQLNSDQVKNVYERLMGKIEKTDNF